MQGVELEPVDAEAGDSLAMMAGLLPGAWSEMTDAKPSSRVLSRTRSIRAR